MAVTTNNAVIKNANLSTWSPTTLFAAGEQGTWYDPSDLNTMFQDSAATTPVTAVEQPVGLIRDKSGRGNHASQSTSASRPVLSARYNLLTKTEQFDDSAWSKGNITITANDTIAPDGSTTADKIVDTATSGTHRVTRNDSISANTTYKFSCFIKKNTLDWCWLAISPSFASGYTTVAYFFNINAGSVGSVSIDQVGSVTVSSYSAAIQNVGSGWYLCSITITTNSNPNKYDIYIGNATSDGVNSYTGSTSNSSYIWGAFLTVSNDGVAIPYQRVNTSTDYDSNPNLFPYYLKFDGTDDGLVTSSIDFSGGDSISVSAGVRKLSDAALGVVAELSSTIASNNGTFLLSAPNSAAANYNYSSKGTAQSNNTITTYTSPISNVLVCNSVISTDTNNIYVNNGSATASATEQGSGNYGNYAMYLGRRGGSSSPFNGRLFNLIVRAGSLSTTQAAQIATYLNGKDKIF